MIAAFEPLFQEAAFLARELQGKAAASMKSDTGNLDADIVTEADLAVQRFLLERLAATELADCAVLAEEATPELVGRFSGTSGRFLSLDPIDGTRRYSEGSAHFCTIVGLHDGERPLYSYLFYPRLGWWARLTDRLETGGRLPELPSFGDALVYGNVPPPPGYRAFSHVEVGEVDIKMLLLAGLAGGFYAVDPNAYDGIVGYHFGLACGRRILSQGRLPDGSLGGPFTLQGRPSGASIRYPGYYLVLPP